MDAEQLLRRYLEQRREMGEREYVLDDLSVDDVLRILGARGHTTAAESDPPFHRAHSVEKLQSQADEQPGGLERSSATDWRSALRDAEPAPLPPPPRLATVPPSVTAATEEVFHQRLRESASIAEVAVLVSQCQRCPLFRTALNHVPGEGNPNADFMCVGEAPGETEDQTGRPFVGRAGQLLTKILAAINLSREEVFIANVLKHRPPGNRNPEPREVTACKPFLVRQIELVQPRVILALGTFAAQSLLETTLPLGRLRGTVHKFVGVPVIVTYHPAALLRNPHWKRPAWEDVQHARRLLDSAGA